jgi:DNA-directed RNA polymerase subunit RPC12/RpoP
MAVEKVGDDDRAKRRVTCRDCGSILEYLPRDVEHKTHHDYSGGSDTYSFIKCPECKATVYVKE